LNDDSYCLPDNEKFIGQERKYAPNACEISASALAEHDANPGHIKVKSFIESVTADHITFDKSF